MKGCELLRANINREARSPRNVAELVTHYTDKELSANGNKAHSTREMYGSYIKTWIVPKWGRHSMSDVRTVDVEAWLRTLPLANASRAKIRSVMSAIFSHAMRWEFFDRNPITMVRQSAKRVRLPDVLTVEEIGALLGELADPCRTAVLLAATTGSLKTEASGKAVPMDSALASALLDWRGRCPYNQDADFLFGSPDMDGQQPYWPDSLLRKVIRAAAVRAEITKHIGWHSFRENASNAAASGRSLGQSDAGHPRE